MNVKDIMARKVVSTVPGAQVREIWRKVFSAHINALPVVDKNNKLIGILSKEDMLKAMYPDYQEYFEDITGIKDFEEMENKMRSLGSKKASDIMCKRVVYTREDTPIMRALSRMIVRRLNQLPVLNQNDVVTGMVTKGDIFYALLKKSRKGLQKKKT